MIVKKENIAVIVVDMQDFFLEKLSAEKRKALVGAQLKIVDFCVAGKIPVVVLEYKDRGQTTAILRRAIGRAADKEMITKSSNGGFTNTNLDAVLKDRKIKSLVLMGINASGCVQDTAIGALNRGYKMVSAKEVIASASKRDSNLATSKRWYPKRGLFFENVKELLEYMRN